MRKRIRIQDALDGLQQGADIRISFGRHLKSSRLAARSIKPFYGHKIQLDLAISTGLPSERRHIGVKPTLFTHRGRVGLTRSCRCAERGMQSVDKRHAGANKEINGFRLSCNL
jgi:hypothetical protein